MSKNPFDRCRQGFDLTYATVNPDQPAGGNDDVFNAMGTSSKSIAETQRAANAPATNVNFPRHLFIPEGAQSLDFRRVVNLPSPNTDYELFRFVAPPGAVTRFISYGVFNDGSNGADFNFKPLVDGSRIFPYHGDPSDNFKIYLGLGPDLSNTSLIPCQLYLQPGQVLQWLVTNTCGVDTSMGVRMVGYFDTAQQRVTGRFGG
jgi:hypothetical protein